MTIQDVVARFNTTPFLFAGSGITRRYYHLPDWVGLLTHFAGLLKKDEFAFRAYESRVPAGTKQEDRLPVVASLIEQDFNLAWFDNAPGLRSGIDGVTTAVAQGTSPFKAEIAAYLKSLSTVDVALATEVEKLKEISKSNLSGVITTNYDRFFEDTFEGYKAFVGQDELVFSQLQGIAEIYKIHGSVETPSSIVINQEDYELFHEKGKYLAAKLMTIFMEYPIIFIGYSISDADIQAILADVVECLPPEKVPLLQKRFVFVEYKPTQVGANVSALSMTFSGKIIEMTKVTVADFSILYDALSVKKAALPVKILRRFKDELYTFALTKEPGTTMQVASLDDRRIDENMLALTIGLAQTGRYGLARAVNSEQWYRNIVLQDLPYTIEDMLEYVYPELAKQNSWKLPVWFYIHHSKKTSVLAESKAPHSYSEIVTGQTIQRNRTAAAGRNAMQIWTAEKSNFSRALRILGNLPETSVSVDDLQTILEEIFGENSNVISSLTSQDRSALHRLIRILDFLKYGQKKTP